MKTARKRAKKARKYFQGGKMPDGLELFPLDGGKLEIMQEIIESSETDEIDEAALGAAMLFMYSSRYKTLKTMDLEEIIERGTELGREATLEDRQAAEEVILADFDALGASMTTQAGKEQARSKQEEEPSHLDTPVSSGPDSNLDIAEKTSKPPARLKSSKCSLPPNTPTSQKENSGTGLTETSKNSPAQERNYEALAVPNG